MTILDGLKKLYVKLGGTIDEKHSYDDIGRLMEDVGDVISGSNELILKGTISHDYTDDSDIITFEDEVTYETITNALIAGKQPILELTETEFDTKYWARLSNRHGDSYVFLCTSFTGGEMIYHTSIGKDYTKYYWNHYSL